MKKKIIVNYRTTEKRAAVIENGKLVETFIEEPNRESVVGNIYKGRVEKVIPGLQAAFVNIGFEQSGFLQIDQLSSFHELEPAKKDKISISNLLHEGQEILVQVIKDAFAEKGPRLTTLLELSGHYVVYLPNGRQIAVSKKIDEKERNNWRLFGQALCHVNEGEGIIFRTSCSRKHPEIVQNEFDYLKGNWEELQKKQVGMKCPSLLLDQSGLIEKLVTEVIGEDATEIIVDDALVFRSLRDRLSSYHNDSIHLLLYMNKEDIFSYYEIEQELDRAIKPYVELENGASLMIQQTEALTVIDVNTGKFTGKYNAQATIVKTNEFAAVEIARQLRLRNIGGMILIDFINMSSSKNQDLIKEKLTAALKADRSFTKVYGFTQLGLLEMTRKKEQKSLLEKLTVTCPTCQEVGRVYSSEQIAFRVERTLWQYKGMDHEAIWIEAPADVVEIFHVDDHLKQLQQALGYRVFITSSEKFVDSFEVRHIGSESDIKKRLYN